jgi:hypothetical protein
MARKKATMSEGKQFDTEEAKRIGDELGIDWSAVDLEQFRQGLGVEMEHGTHPVTDVTGGDPLLTGKIAWAHLNEYADYYTRLNQMETEAEAYWAGRPKRPLRL